MMPRKSAKHVSVKLLVSNQSLEVGFKQKWEKGDTTWAKPGNGNVVLQYESNGTANLDNRPVCGMNLVHHFL